MRVAVCLAFLATLLAQRPLPAQTVERNVPYRSGASQDQRLDLHTPSKPGAPVVVFLHGGSLMESGERRSSEMYAGVCPGLAARGIACAAVDYRLSPAHRWPAMPEDVAAAVRWVRDSAGRRGVDASRIILAGHSSGCQLAAVVGLDSLYLGELGMHPRDLAGVIAMGCTLAPWDTSGRRLTEPELRAAFERDPAEAAVFCSLAWRIRANPTLWIGAHAPPFLVLVAESERFFPSILEEGAAFVRRLREIDRPADLRILAGRRHVTTTSGFANPDDPVANLVADFARDPDSVVRTP